MDALALLNLQIAWGADEALLEAPLDRFTIAAPRAAAPAAASAPAGPAPVRGDPPDRFRPPADPLRELPAQEPPRGNPAERALSLALQAETLPALRAAIESFDGCALRQTASHTVFAAGDPAAGVLAIGDPPGAEEDRSGQPFAGAEGAFLDRMLASIGVQRDTLLLTPLIPWRPPGGRPPSAPELAICLPFLHRLIALADPRLIVIFGTLPARALHPGRRRGVAWVDLSGPWGTRPSLALPGLSALLKTPTLRRDAWKGLRLLRRALDGAGTH
ncbi:MAG: uracil-DNA glycosylase [Rhodospirillales bacterium]|nr:uracil-DNA glycosylase [Rhodospirillales bacterium]